MYTANAGTPLKGQIIVDPVNPAWLKYYGGGPHFTAGPGDPEDFLYRGSLNSDGTRNGDQLSLINKLKSTGANSIYFQAVRSHGGDGDSTHNPFNNHDPGSGINEAVLDQWETWFTEMDNSGIVSYFFFYDDSARIWNTGDNCERPERLFIETLVNRFEHHKNLIWVIAEEYAEKYTPARISDIASVIRAADDHDHVISVHKNNGLSFAEFKNDPNIDQFAIQYNRKSAAQMHDGMLRAWGGGGGRYNLIMSESAGHGKGVDGRKKNWAIAMGGAYVMVFQMFIDSTPIEELIDLGRLVNFMESTNFNEMQPHDELGGAGTEYVLALPGQSYIAYTSALNREKIGFKDMSEGTYRIRWFDIISGSMVTEENVEVTKGVNSWDKPSNMGKEVAVYIVKENTADNVSTSLKNH